MALRVQTNNYAHYGPLPPSQPQLPSPPPSQPQLPSPLYSSSTANWGGSSSSSNVNSGFSSSNSSNYVENLESYFTVGNRFHPRDDELIGYYLRRKIANEPLPPHKIMEIDIYQYSPEHLAEIYKQERASEMFFFTPRSRKYPHGNRPNREVAGGLWKASGSYERVLNIAGDHTIGFKRSLVFYRGNPKEKKTKYKKTNWIMHEFTIADPLPTNSVDTYASIMDWVLCRIYERAQGGEFPQQPPQVPSLEIDDRINNHMPYVDEGQALSVANHGHGFVTGLQVENPINNNNMLNVDGHQALSVMSHDRALAMGWQIANLNNYKMPTCGGDQALSAVNHDHPFVTGPLVENRINHNMPNVDYNQASLCVADHDHAFATMLQVENSFSYGSSEDLFSCGRSNDLSPFDSSIMKREDDDLIAFWRLQMADNSLRGGAFKRARRNLDK